MNYEEYISNYHSLEDWLDDFGLNKIRISDPLDRIKRVRFLGTMMYVTNLKHNFNRYEHTVNVAKLAYKMAEQFQLPDELKEVILVISLIHDIGHLPFSHASEVFFKQNWGKYHTGHSSRLAAYLSKSLKLAGDVKLSKLVKKANAILNNRFQFKNLNHTLAIYEIFHGVLSADTLDGINRAAISIGLNTIDPFSIINKMEIEDGKSFLNYEAIDLVTKFLKLKKNIYLNYVYSPAGMAAEAMLTKALELAFPKYTEKNDFLALDDDSTRTRMIANGLSREIVQMLENRELFYSLRECSIDKYRMIIDSLKNCKKKNSLLKIKKALEVEFRKQMNLSNPIDLILHTTIKLKFPNVFSTQTSLFKHPLPIKNLEKFYGSKKTYGESIDLFFSKNCISKIALIHPFNLDKSVFPNNLDRNNINKASYVEKHSGAYMTPPEIAEFLTKWAIRKPDDLILDPSSGEGIFLKKAFDKLTELGAKPDRATNYLFGAESEYKYYVKSLNIFEKNFSKNQNNIHHKDFFHLLQNDQSNIFNRKFDAIIGNPPYIRHHRFQNQTRDISCQLVKKFTDIQLSKRTSSWAPYFICAATLLKKIGRIAMVLPFELLTTDYALPVRKYISDNFKSFIIIFFKKFVFPSVQQEIILLLASNAEPEKVGKIELKNIYDLEEDVLNNIENIKLRVDEWGAHKWTYFLTKDKVIQLIDELLLDSTLSKFKDIFNISIGLVTGNNKYFTLSEKEASKFKIDKKWLVEIITKAKLLNGSIISSKDYQKFKNLDQKCHLLRISGVQKVDDDENLFEYLKNGKNTGIDQGHKCRTRWPWYSVPMQPIPDAFLTYMSGLFPRIVLNSAKVHSTNTIHNVSFKNQISTKLRRAYIASFYSSLSMLSAELIGRSYGGGVLKLEIKEAREVLLPNLKKFPDSLIIKLSKILDQIDTKIRNHKDDIFYELDDIVLKKGMGLSDTTIKMIQSEKKRIRKRRVLK